MALLLRFSRSLASRVALHPQACADDVDQEYPLRLTTARIPPQDGSRTAERHSSSREPLAPAPVVEMHPLTAGRYGLLTGAAVRLTTRHGAATFHLRLTGTIREDMVLVPFSWGGGHVLNRLTNRVLDPLSKTPAFKICAVRVEPA